MKIHKNNGQGRTVTDPDTGRIYPIPEGGSDGGESVSDGSGTEGTVEGSQGGETQSDPAPSTEGGGEGSGQGFLEPYLRDVPEEQRSVVEPVLEKYRQEQDRNFNQRFEQLQEQARIPMTIYESLLDDPIATLDWIADRMQEERGLDIRDELKDRWYAEQSGQGQGNDQSGQDPNQPLTQAQLDEILEQRERDREQRQQQETFQQQQAEKQAQQVYSWIDDAAKKFSLPLDEGDADDPLKTAIIMQANNLHEQGIARGQAAIEMAAEAISKKLSKQSGQQQIQQTPPLADGGTPPPSPDINYGSSKDRKARMLEMFKPAS